MKIETRNYSFDSAGPTKQFGGVDLSADRSPRYRQNDPEHERRAFSGHAARDAIVAWLPPKSATGRQMTAAIAPVEASSLYLAAVLFENVSTLANTRLAEMRSDGVYADCLLASAFRHLLVGLGTEPAVHSDRLRAAASAIKDCDWLSDAVQYHVSQTLRDVADGLVEPRVAFEIVSAAANRQSHQMVIDAIREVGSHGLGEIAGAIELLAPADRVTN